MRFTFKAYRRLIRSCCQSLVHCSLRKKRVIALEQTIALKPDLDQVGLLDKDQKERKIICFAEPPVFNVRSSLQKRAPERTAQT